MCEDERSLLIRAQNDDAEAETELLLKYSPLVKSIARSYYTIGVDDEDLWQLGLIALMNAVRTYDLNESKASFATYASACIHNIIKTELRRKKNQTKDDIPLSDIEDRPSKFDVEKLYEDKETEHLLMRAISSVLTECEMNVLMLYLSAMSYQEISDKLGIEKKKVDNTIYSFKKKIKKLLENK